MSDRSALLRLAAGALLLLLAPPAGPKRFGGQLIRAASGKSKKGGNHGALPQLAMQEALVAKGDAVQDCAVHKGLDVKGGPKRIEISTKVTVSGRGQVIDVRTDVKVDKGDGAPVRECVDKLIRSIKFPPCDAPIVTIERSWTIAG
jgi:hypothetical protein